jgi:hypothetical protein
MRISALRILVAALMLATLQIAILVSGQSKAWRTSSSCYSLEDVGLIYGLVSISQFPSFLITYLLRTP